MKNKILQKNYKKFRQMSKKNNSSDIVEMASDIIPLFTKEVKRLEKIIKVSEVKNKEGFIDKYDEKLISIIYDFVSIMTFIAFSSIDTNVAEYFLTRGDANISESINIIVVLVLYLCIYFALRVIDFLIFKGYKLLALSTLKTGGNKILFNAYKIVLIVVFGIALYFLVRGQLA